MDLSPVRPEPIYLKHIPEKVDSRSDFNGLLNQLIHGKDLLIDDSFSTGLKLLSVMKQYAYGKGSKNEGDFKEYRSKRRKYHYLSNQILVQVRNGKLKLNKSPDIGWLEILYPDHDEFYLTFPQVQGMNSSWQWYLNGIQYPVLDEKIHPYYGTYFPTRNDHLLLFEKYLQRENLDGITVLDVGTGSGVLSFQMLRHNVSHVLASDINPNAILSVKENSEKMGIHPDKLGAKVSDLFDDINDKVDLIVFNPPWLPEYDKGEGLDLAIYYPEDLFNRFFSGALERLNKGGKVVLLYSNLANVEGVTMDHPVIKELAMNRRFRKSKLIKHKAAQKSKKTNRRDHRKREYIELWELIPY